MCSLYLLPPPPLLSWLFFSHNWSPSHEESFSGCPQPISASRLPSKASSFSQPLSPFNFPTSFAISVISVCSVPSSLHLSFPLGLLTSWHPSEAVLITAEHAMTRADKACSDGRQKLPQVLLSSLPVRALLISLRRAKPRCSVCTGQGIATSPWKHQQWHSAAAVPGGAWTSQPR